MSNVKVFNEKEIENLTPMIMAVQQFLFEKTMFEKKKQDKLNMTTLGGIGFYFDYKDDNTYLMYTKHPKDWHETSIKYDIEEYKKYMLVQQGAYVER